MAFSAQKRGFYPAIPDNERVAAAKELFGRKMDPVGKGDTALMAIGSIMLAFTGALVACAWWQRNYRPVRAKNLPLTTVMYLGSIVWFLGDMHVNGNFRLLGAWQVCKVFGLYFRVAWIFGFPIALFVRIYTLDLIFIQKKRARGWRLYGPAIAWALCGLTCLLVGQFLPDENSEIFVPEIQLCVVSYTFLFISLGYLWAICLGILCVMWRVRLIYSVFAEGRETVIIIFIGLTDVIQATILNLSDHLYLLNAKLRIMSTAYNSVVAFTIIWVILATPVYHSIFNRDVYLEEWLDTLAEEGLNNVHNHVQHSSGQGERRYSPIENNSGIEITLSESSSTAQDAQARYIGDDLNLKPDGSVPSDTNIAGWHQASDPFPSPHLDDTVPYWQDADSNTTRHIL